MSAALAPKVYALVTEFLTDFRGEARVEQASALNRHIIRVCMWDSEADANAWLKEAINNLIAEEKQEPNNA